MTTIAQAEYLFMPYVILKHVLYAEALQ